MTRPSAKKIERAIAAIEAETASRQPQICPLCERPIPADAKSSRHHLIPRLKAAHTLSIARKSGYRFFANSDATETDTGMQADAVRKHVRRTVHLHQICHSAIHARFSEAEIANRLADIEALRAEPEMARFIAWVRTKPPAFHAPTRSTNRKRENGTARSKN